MEEWVSPGAAVQSVVVSRDAGGVQSRLLESLHRGLLQSVSELLASLSGRRMFAFVIAAAEDADQASSEASVGERRLRQFEERLVEMLEGEPLEDGISHPGENIVNEVLHSEVGRKRALEWLRRMVLDPERPVVGAAVLRLLCRIGSVGSEVWREGIVRDALRSEHVELRDAAVQAVESWADPGLARVLRGHRDEVGWLQRYVEGVLSDLGG